MVRDFESVSTTEDREDSYDSLVRNASRDINKMGEDYTPFSEINLVLANDNSGELTESQRNAINEL